MRTTSHGSLFSGIGGFDLAAAWMGWRNVFHCERDLFCRRILKHYWPKTNSYEDVKKFDAKKYAGKVEVISGGFPCQPFSTAGQRRGKEDDRYLWPAMFGIVRTIQPRWVVAENVRGLLNQGEGMVFEQIHVDLETAGYHVQSFILPAAGVGAPHRRERVFIVAHANRHGCQWDSQAATVHYQRIQERLAQRPESDALPDVGNAANPEWRERPQPGFDPGMGRIQKPVEEDFFRNFPSESPVCGEHDGIPRELDGITFPNWRKATLKAYGNAVVPAVAYQIFKAISLIDKECAGSRIIKRGRFGK